MITPALTGELKGALYLGRPASGPIRKPPFTVYLTFAGHGVLVKIRGTADAKPGDGPGHDDVRRKPGAAVQRTETAAERRVAGDRREPSRVRRIPRRKPIFTPWTSPFEAGCHPARARRFEITGCQAPRFQPSFGRACSQTRPAATARLRVTFSREDADEELGGLTVTMPAGLSRQHLEGPAVPRTAGRAKGPVPEASQIGEVTAGAGPGPNRCSSRAARSSSPAPTTARRSA